MNDAEAPELVRYAHARGITPRFIELMPFGKGSRCPRGALIEQLRPAGMPLENAPVDAAVDAGPARYLARCDRRAWGSSRR